MLTLCKQGLPAEEAAVAAEEAAVAAANHSLTHSPTHSLTEPTAYTNLPGNVCMVGSVHLVGRPEELNTIHTLTAECIEMTLFYLSRGFYLFIIGPVVFTLDFASVVNFLIYEFLIFVSQ